MTVQLNSLYLVLDASRSKKVFPLGINHFGTNLQESEKVERIREQSGWIGAGTNCGGKSREKICREGDVAKKKKVGTTQKCGNYGTEAVAFQVHEL